MSKCTGSTTAAPAVRRRVGAYQNTRKHSWQEQHTHCDVELRNDAIAAATYRTLPLSASAMNSRTVWTPMKASACVWRSSHRGGHAQAKSRWCSSSTHCMWHLLQIRWSWGRCTLRPSPEFQNSARRYMADLSETAP